MTKIIFVKKLEATCPEKVAGTSSAFAKLLKLGALRFGPPTVKKFTQIVDFARRSEANNGFSGTLGAPHLKPTAKRVIYLFFSGGPSHIDMYDYHPKMRDIHGTELPDSIRNGQRITGMTSGQKSFPCVAPMFEFSRHGQNHLLGWFWSDFGSGFEFCAKNCIG